MSAIKYWVSTYDEITQNIDDLEVILDFAKQDQSLEKEVEEAYGKTIEKLEALELRNMLGEEADNLGAILKINSGAGGTESNDWSLMLMRMYARWGERNGYKGIS